MPTPTPSSITDRLPKLVVKDNLILRQVIPRPGQSVTLAPGETLVSSKDAANLEWAPLTQPRWVKEISKGYTDSVTNRTYWIDDQSVFLRGGKLAVLTVALSKGLITNETPQVVFDKTNTAHTLTTAEYIGLILRMSAYYEQLYATYCP